MKTRTSTVWYYHAPAIACGVAILVLSSIPNLNAPSFGLPGIDKIAHLLEYAGFAFLLARSIGQSEKKTSRLFWKCFLAIALFAALDENWQRFVPGRFPDLLDYLVDLLGGVIGFGFRHVLASKLPNHV